MNYNYLATPYTNYPSGHDAAYRDAASMSAVLMQAGVCVFSPVVHFHPISQVMPEKPHKFWMRQCMPFMTAAKSIIVGQLPGWGESKGVFEEIEFFKRGKRPVRYLGWPLPPAMAGDMRQLRWLVGLPAPDRVIVR